MMYKKKTEKSVQKIAKKVLGFERKQIRNKLFNKYVVYGCHDKKR